MDSETVEHVPISDDQQLDKHTSEETLNVENKNGTVKESKVQKIGMLCVSPGLHSETLNDKMLSTLKVSEDMEKAERSRRVSDVSDSMQNIPRKQIDTQEDLMLVKDQLKDLKKNSLNRKSIPAPLAINDDTTNMKSGFRSSRIQGRNTFITNDAPFSNTNTLRSAPACVTKHTIQKRPRVQYCGKTPRMNPPNTSTSNYPRVPFHRRQASSEFPTNFTPFQNQYVSPAPVDPYMYPPYYIPHPSGHYLVPNVMGFTPQSPVAGPMPFNINRSANPMFSPQVSLYQTWPKQDIKITNKRENTIFNKNNSEPVHINLSENSTSKDSKSDDESTALALDDEDISDNNESTIETKVKEMIDGEISLLGHEFKFEYQKSSRKMDKKIFISVCNKIWDDTFELEKRTNQ
ncbi:hypothetical protein TPHA_0C01670 [Tetrapisispora phaffii CBS 4417]|uniref:Uncharacterized protein n=1 Tax=Tetrapisispora phaffii (strain ATCC 24235 / CBS 4417 / NBRC 1672 / NRRL Y-8282 / UCD 70-5) TaxID=1071381 RepID=G8BRE7_TETPH|nr:hypothetical protein TPHA_0C01670 [Tetrapisispora phaffii CBS 4417]CCE62323.1 hypothetical protein TPHA_0C01670 [Tetrapisispora phaffii CBS 4417]